MSDEPHDEHAIPTGRSAQVWDAYRRALQAPDLTDNQIDDMRQHMARLAETLCEHVWGKRFY